MQAPAFLMPQGGVRAMLCDWDRSDCHQHAHVRRLCLQVKLEDVTAEKQQIEQQLAAKEHSLEVNISQVQCSALLPAQEYLALLLLVSLCKLAAASLARTPA